VEIAQSRIVFPVVGALLCATASAQVTQRVSLSSSGVQSHGFSMHSMVSGDGRFVIFESSGNDLVPGDTNGALDIFVRDRRLGTTERVDVSTEGVQANTDPMHVFGNFVSISADGRFATFSSEATNLVQGDTNLYEDVFVHDRVLGLTERVSVDSSGGQGNAHSRENSTSADGRYVAFMSLASNLVANDANLASDVFVRDRRLGLTERVSVDANGVGGDGNSDFPSISADGRYVAFYSLATNLVANDTNGKADVFVRDRLLGTTVLASRTIGGLQGDGDSSLLFFPRAVSPNHHALAERFGLFDRFFVNAEVSAQGHMWSTAGYVTDFGEKTTPDSYRGKRPDREDTDDIDEPATGFLWSAAAKKQLWVRNYGEAAAPVQRASGDTTAPRYEGVRAASRPFTSPTYPPFDMTITDQRRADAWLAEFREHERQGKMPALETMHLPSDHTSGARRGLPTPKAYVADNDYALGRIIEALSSSQFWRSTAVFVVEDDAQAGPDHVDSHRSVLIVISPWAAGGVLHRFVNTTDVLATVEEILGLGTLSQFDHFGRPLRDVWRSTPDLRPYVALTPTQSMTERNLALDDNARRSARLDLATEDRAPDDEFNRILWRAIKGDSVPYPGVRRTGLAEWIRGR